MLNDILWPDHIQWQPPTDQTLLDLLPNFEWFPWNICEGCGMPIGDAYSSAHLVPSLWDLHMFYLLRPILFRTCRYFTGLRSSNIPRYFLDFALQCYKSYNVFCFSDFKWDMEYINQKFLVFYYKNFLTDCDEDISGLATLPSDVKCNLGDDCHGATCCMNIPFLQRKLQANVSIDTCNQKIIVTIERLTVEIDLYGYEFGKQSIKFLRYKKVLDVMFNTCIQEKTIIIMYFKKTWCQSLLNVR